MYVDGCHQLTVVVEQLVMCNMAVHQKHLEHGYMKFAEYILHQRPAASCKYALLRCVNDMILNHR